jgi:hypothetical protein
MTDSPVEANKPPCKPYICPFPPAVEYKSGTIWVCEGCSTPYRLTRKLPYRPWRKMYSPNGHWEIAGGHLLRGWGLILGAGVLLVGVGFVALVRLSATLGGVVIALGLLITLVAYGFTIVISSRLRKWYPK